MTILAFVKPLSMYSHIRWSRSPLVTMLVTDYARGVAGEGGCKGSPHPAVCKMARRWTRLLSFAAFVGGVVALHYFPKHRYTVLTQSTYNVNTVYIQCIYSLYTVYIQSMYNPSAVYIAGYRHTL